MQIINVPRDTFRAAIQNAVAKSTTDEVRRNADALWAFADTATYVAVGGFDAPGGFKCPLRALGLSGGDQPCDWGFIGAFDDAFPARAFGGTAVLRVIDA